MEGMAMYLAFPAAQYFHSCLSKWRVLDGSNRAGKTLAAAAEACRAWLSCDPFNKYIPVNGKSLVIGLDGDHLGQMWAKCAQEGAFKKIKDEHTGAWRAVRGNPLNTDELDPYDDAYREKWRDAPPLIPERMIKGNIGWEDKAKGIPRFVAFTNGWPALWRSSEGKSPQGEHYQFGWIDEQIANEQFYLELVRGLVSTGESEQHKPRGFWSATPQTSNLQLYELRERADAGEGDVGAFSLLIKNNPFISDKEKLEFFYSLPAEEREVRYNGIYTVVLRRLYGAYDAQGIHGCEPFPIPDTWTRVLVLDPGRKHAGTVLAAVDPEEKHLWVYDAFEHNHGDAESWAQVIKEKSDGVRYEYMVIDQRMGRQNTVGDSVTVALKYMRALKEVDIEPVQRGPLEGFFKGNDDVSAREKCLLSMLNVRSYGAFSGTPQLKIFKGCSGELDRQIRHAQINPKTGKREKVKEDILVCLEYLAGFNPAYKLPTLDCDTKEDLVWKAFQEKKKRMARQPSRRSKGISM